MSPPWRWVGQAGVGLPVTTATALLAGSLILAPVPLVLGFLFAIVLAPPGVIIGSVLIGGVAGALVHECLARAASTGPGWLRAAGRVQPTRQWPSALGGALVLIAVAGAATFLGPGAGLLIVVLTVGASGALVLFPSTARTPEPPRHPSPDPPTAPVTGAATELSGAWAEDLRGYSGEELSLAWRTCHAGWEPGDGPGLARIAEQRGAYLDELERRDPVGFHAWLAGGARSPDRA